MPASWMARGGRDCFWRGSCHGRSGSRVLGAPPAHGSLVSTVSWYRSLQPSVDSARVRAAGRWSAPVWRHTAVHGAARRSRFPNLLRLAGRKRDFLHQLSTLGCLCAALGGRNPAPGRLYSCARRRSFAASQLYAVYALYRQAVLRQAAQRGPLAGSLPIFPFNHSASLA